MNYKNKKMQVTVIAQATGKHGWTSFESYVAGLSELGVDPIICKPKANWGATSLDNDDGLQQILLDSGAGDILFFCGFDWHSQPIHYCEKHQELFNKNKAIKVGFFQEHLSANWIQGDILIKNEFDKALINSLKYLTHVVCNHEEDVEYVSKHFDFLKIIFLPFAVDTSVFKQDLSERDSRAFFRGKSEKLMAEDPYHKRSKLISNLKIDNNFKISEFEPNKYLNKSEQVKDYVYDLNRYYAQINLPSLSPSITCRPFEIGATGGLLFNERPDGIISQAILTKNNVIFYDVDADNDLREKVKSALNNLNDFTGMIKNHKNFVTAKHSHTVRVRQILDWLANIKTKNVIYKELVFNQNKKKIAIDLVFFQYAQTGIARVWTSIIEDLAKSDLCEHFILFNRKGTKLPFSRSVFQNLEVIEINTHSYLDLDAEVLYIDFICVLYNIDVFTSTYFTYSSNIQSALLLHDFIPEVINNNCRSDPMWLEKSRAIKRANTRFFISQATFDDFQNIYPNSSGGCSFYSFNKASSYLPTVNELKCSDFRNKYSLKRKIILFVGERVGYQGYKNIRGALLAFNYLFSENILNKDDFTFLFVGGATYGDEITVEPQLEKVLYGVDLKRLSLDDQELACAYSISELLVYSSLIEGFGLPPIEASNFGTPAILVDNKINRELWGEEFPMAKSGSVTDLFNFMSEIFTDSNPIKTKLAEFSKNRRPQLISRGKTQSTSIIESLILLSKSCKSDFIKSHKSQIDNWIFRLGEFSYFGVESTTTYKTKTKTKNKNKTKTKSIKVTCILSLFKAREFLKHCLDDLVTQDLFINGEMEIIIIDSASPQNETEIVEVFTEAYTNIFYFKTPFRESLYTAWARACTLARGQYITNTNADDRHRADCMTKLSNFLDCNEEIQLVYPQQYITFEKNESFQTHRPQRVWGWPKYTIEQLKIGNHVGSQPMWRRSVHSIIGHFRPDFTCAGDYEFWLRIATKVGPLALYPIPLGSYYYNPNGIEHGDPIKSKVEMDEICDRYDITRNYEISDSDVVKDVQRDFDTLQYNGIALQNSLTIVIKCLELENLETIVDMVESQDIFLDHKLKLLFDTTFIKNIKVKELAINLCSKCSYRSFGSSDMGCKIDVHGIFENNNSLFKTLVTSLYEENNQIIEYDYNGNSVLTVHR